MNKTRKPLIAANWKMNNTISDSLKFVTIITHELKAIGNADVVICPPFTAIYSTGVALAETEFKLGAQNMHFEDSGAFTGEISGIFLKETGCEYVIIGHSERRAIFKETDEDISKKVQTALRHELIPILCVGENEQQRESNQTWNVIEGQLNKNLQGLSIGNMTNFVIAYEPVWAIGTGKTATPEQAEEVHSQIRNYLSKRFDGATSQTVRILYGGSVKGKNAHEIMSKPNIDGVLVGGAALNPSEFSQIIRAVQ